MTRPLKARLRCVAATATGPLERLLTEAADTIERLTRENAEIQEELESINERDEYADIPGEDN